MCQQLAFSSPPPPAPQLARISTRCVFEPLSWRNQYLRNSRRNGQKNLRCFPECSPLHQAMGFCGKTHIEVEVTVAPAMSHLCVFGELALAATSRWELDDVVRVEDILVRSREHMRRNLLAAERVADDGHGFVFSAMGNGWHYDWMGSRHASSSLHAFTVYVMAPIAAGGQLQVLGVFRSPVFTVSSSRFRIQEPGAALSQQPVCESGDDTVVLVTRECGHGSQPAFEHESEPMKRTRKAPCPSTNTTPPSPLLPGAPDSVPETEEALVLRILSAVGCLDALESFVNPPPDAAAAAPAAATTQALAADYAWLAPTMDTFFDNLELWDDAADIVNLQTLQQERPDANRRQGVQVIGSLAHFLVAERSITEAMAQNASMSYDALIGIISRELGAFLACQHNGLTIAELDGLLKGVDPLHVVPPPPLPVTAAAAAAMPPPAAAAPLQLLLPSEVLRPGNPFLPPGSTLIEMLTPRALAFSRAEFDVSGFWQQPDALLADFSAWREQRGMNAAMRKLLSHLEARFKLVHTSPAVLTLHIMPRLLAPDVIHFQLDALPYSVTVPMPLNAPTFRHTLQSWACGPVWATRVAIEHAQNQRLTVLYWKMPDGLHTLRVYESRRAASSFSGTGLLPQGGVSVLSDEWLVARIVKAVCPPVED